MDDHVVSNGMDHDLDLDLDLGLDEANDVYLSSIDDFPPPPEVAITRESSRSF